jgi:hypothetical protein
MIIATLSTDVIFQAAFSIGPLSSESADMTPNSGDIGC